VKDDLRIRGQGASSVVDGGGTNRVFLIDRLQDSNMQVVFDSFVIQNGQVGNGGAGGGLVNTASLTLRDMRLTGNRANNGGGGAIVNTASGRIQMVRCLLDNNQTMEGLNGLAGDGGALYHSSNNPIVISASVFENNRCGRAGSGGAIFHNAVVNSGTSLYGDTALIVQDSHNLQATVAEFASTPGPL